MSSDLAVGNLHARTRQLLAAVVPSAELLAFRRDVLGPLLGAGSPTRGDLYRTLEVYVACGGNTVRTARRLQAHRNTVLYRLERLRTLLGVDLRDPNARFALELALHAGTIAGDGGDSSAMAAAS